MNTTRPVLTLKKPHRAARKTPVIPRSVVRPTAKSASSRSPDAARSANKAGSKPGNRAAGKTRTAERRRRAAQPPARPPSTGTDADLLAALQAVAPELWNPEAPVPLAVGIHKQLHHIAEQVDMSRKSVRKFLSRWTSSTRYQQALIEPGAVRFNLDGSSAGEVSEEHRELSRQRVTAPRRAEEPVTQD